jgi:peptidoglycan/xylan/chitin deacetylase (PgdA/CDA1 family)
VTQRAFERDVEDNLQAIEAFGVRRGDVRYWVPAYEWYNAEIAAWSADLGLTLVNFTPGTRSNADYTGEADRNFVPSQQIIASILAREQEDPHGLRGCLLLLHLGAGPGRTDKLHSRFGELLDALAGRGYTFVRVDDLLR